MRKLHELYNQVLNENSTVLSELIPKIEKSFNIKLSKKLGKSQAIVYLTTDNRVLKVTPSDSEMSLSLEIQKTPSKYFPKIFKVNKVSDTWYAILKEFIPELSEIQKKEYDELQSFLEAFLKTPSNSLESMNYLLLDTKSTSFIKYLKNDKPHLLNMYDDLIHMIEYNNNNLDMHVDNLGSNGRNLVLYDY